MTVSEPRGIGSGVMSSLPSVSPLERPLRTVFPNFPVIRGPFLRILLAAVCLAAGCAPRRTELNLLFVELANQGSAGFAVACEASMAALRTANAPLRHRIHAQPVTPPPGLSREALSALAEGLRQKGETVVFVALDNPAAEFPAGIGPLPFVTVSSAAPAELARAILLNLGLPESHLELDGERLPLPGDVLSRRRPGDAWDPHALPSAPVCAQLGWWPAEWVFRQRDPTGQPWIDDYALARRVESPERGFQAVVLGHRDRELWISRRRVDKGNIQEELDILFCDGRQVWREERRPAGLPAEVPWDGMALPTAWRWWTELRGEPLAVSLDCRFAWGKEQNRVRSPRPWEGRDPAPTDWSQARVVVERRFPGGLLLRVEGLQPREAVWYNGTQAQPRWEADWSYGHQSGERFSFHLPASLPPGDPLGWVAVQSPEGMTRAWPIPRSLAEP